MSHVFGPVPSRRLGLSLGVDLIPRKTCTYDCIYCQVGRTTAQTTLPRGFVSPRQVVGEIREQLRHKHPDVITLAGSGEPTLYSEIQRVIASVKDISDIPLALLTNGALLCRRDIRNRVLAADIILPTLTTVYESTFQQIHRPCPGLSAASIREGYNRLREVYRGRLYLEVVLLAGINDTDRELEGLKGAIEELGPDRVQLNTVVRPPADEAAVSLDRQRLETIKVLLGNHTEIIADTVDAPHGGADQAVVQGVLEMAARRPLRSEDIGRVFDLTTEQVDELVDRLARKGRLRRKRYRGEVYYTRMENGTRH